MNTETIDHCQVEWFEEGPLYFQHYLDLIASAQRSIHLQTYIFEMDDFGKAVQKALIEAAIRSVKIYVLVDSFGSLSLSENFSNELTKKNVQFARFNSPHFKWLWQWGRRLHHKVLLIDEEKSLIGGINVMSNSFRRKEVSPQLDFAVQLTGAINTSLSKYCQKLFDRASGKKPSFRSLKVWSLPNNKNNLNLRISINDWFLRRRQIAKHYSWLVKNARSEIVIVSSYFFPRRKLMRQLRKAARNGVRVRLILPKYSDWQISVWATQYLYTYFLRNRIEIYLWKQSILHGKLASIDGLYTSVGSFNLHYTSYQQNLEMNVDIRSESFTKNINLKIENWISNGCEKIDQETFNKSASLKLRFLRYFCFLLLSLLEGFSLGWSLQSSRTRNQMLN